MHPLLEKYYNHEITPSEKVELFSLIEKDPELKKEFISYQSLFTLSSSLSRPEDESFARIYLKKFKQNRRKAQTFTFLKHAFRYTAIILITIGVTWYITTRQEEEPVEEIADLYQEFMTPAGQRAMVKLHDGTVVWLNARSTLRYPYTFNGTERKVELDGEAFFEVIHDEELPFIVSTEKLDIKVLGTKFNVFAYKGHDEFRTALLEGAVKIYKETDEENALHIQPNEYVEYIGNRFTRGSFSNDDFLLWRDGVYAFDDQPFQEIVKKLELYYDITILVNNAKLRNYKFSGKFRQRDGVENVLRTLRKVYNFTYYKNEEDNILIIR